MSATLFCTHIDSISRRRTTYFNRKKPSGNMDSKPLGFRVLIGVYVMVESVGHHQAYVVSATRDGSRVDVVLYDNESILLRTTASDVTPIQPGENVNRSLKVLDGPHLGRIGALLMVIERDGGGDEGVVRLGVGDDEETFVFPLSFLAQCLA